MSVPGWYQQPYGHLHCSFTLAQPTTVVEDKISTASLPKPMVTHRRVSLSLSLSLRPLPRGLIDYGEVVQVIHMTLVAMVLYAGLLSWKFNWEVGCTYALQVSVYVVVSQDQIFCVYPAASSETGLLSVTIDAGVGAYKLAICDHSMNVIYFPDWWNNKPVCFIIRPQFLQ